MSTPVVMPQMGESIAEGTIVRWIKKVGDTVDRDEPLFEISTDKVDAEIPSPAAGVLLEIAVKEGETVAGQQRRGDDRRGGRSWRRRQRQGGRCSAPRQPPPAREDAPSRRRRPTARRRSSRPPLSPRAPPAPAATAAPAPSRQPEPEADDGDRANASSPLVRRIAKEHGVDIGRITGSGIGGRVTKQDILGYIDQGNGRAGGAGSDTVDAVTFGGCGDLDSLRRLPLRRRLRRPTSCPCR